MFKQRSGVPLEDLGAGKIKPIIKHRCRRRNSVQRGEFVTKKPRIHKAQDKRNLDEIDIEVPYKLRLRPMAARRLRLAQTPLVTTTHWTTSFC